MKFKKQVKKGDLRPKKLHYTDDELDNSSTNTDSGINVQLGQSNDMFHKQRATKCNRLDCSQSQMRRLRAKLDRIKMQTDDKENDKSIVQNSRNNTIVQESVGRYTKCEKTHTYTSRTKEAGTKGKLTHFRV